MKPAVQARAQELGFDLCRVTGAAPPSSSARFGAWLAAGYHGEMAYLERNAPRRQDPELVLPGVRSVVCLAVSYHGPPPAAMPGAGVVARYARFADYHEVVTGRVNALAAFLDEQGGAGTRSRGYVDTGPVLERDLAQRAGLGFIGKHTNLISRSLGNWFFLAEVLTTLELDPDPPETNRCGSCSRCLAACPTGAIREPFVLDARRCIAYLTIELKGPIPLELRPAVGRRVFGCDDCLEVCPWNRFARAGRLLRDHARPDLATPDLVAWLGLDDRGFRARFAGTPMWRTKRRGLLRNVCVALGNGGDASAIPALQRAAADPEPLIAEHARWALERIAGSGR
jgi:epoxyqueuosine reductase